ncbi:MAG: ribose 5-phosphate isomerase B [Syntrophales bacterium]|nr:ribose 5-phosphate isomerase B [Syntrophales bacterium]MCU0582640.1 ribose 5-phosphate isomerase B [Syntrophales bacterium]
MNIIIGADHAGYALKEAVKAALSTAGCRLVDAGTRGEESVDYPDFGVLAAEGVSSGRFERGILVCGSGVGMAIVANKFPGVRAALCLDEETARLSRQHNDSNVLVLAGRKTDPDTAGRIARVWLETPFEGGRHQKRLDKIRELEQRLCK